MQTCGVVQVAAAPGVCPFALAIAAPHTVQTCGVVQVAAAPGVCPFAGMVVISFVVPQFLQT